MSFLESATALSKAADILGGLLVVYGRKKVVVFGKIQKSDG